MSDDSHEMSSLIFSEKQKIEQKKIKMSAAVVISKAGFDSIRILMAEHIFLYSLKY